MSKSKKTKQPITKAISDAVSTAEVRHILGTAEEQVKPEEPKVMPDDEVENLTVQE